LIKNVLTPAENHPKADETIRKKIRTTRMRLDNQMSAERVEAFFWQSMTTDNGIDIYRRISEIGAPTFEDVRLEFKQLCGRA